ncbi:unnamed protein product [Peronospora destructor]|uniref:Uncharacterized protein n=1 Tax=Peronospora destructor TaxID=86335 RepID=A0AAV0UVE1_9STRA|nr:unnamed protein product [Peronospora destructor]
MAVAEKQQQHSKVDYLADESVAYMANQVLSKYTPSLLRNDVKKAGEADQSDTTENKDIAVTEAATEISNDSGDNADKQLCSESFTASGGRELAAEGHGKELDEKKMESVVMKDILVSLNHKVVKKKT